MKEKQQLFTIHRINRFFLLHFPIATEHFKNHARLRLIFIKPTIYYRFRIILHKIFGEL